MKKYLLLATVAGCLLTSNAMADGQDITIKAKVDIRRACTISEVTDIDYGSVTLKSLASVGSLTMAKDGAITTSSTDIIDFTTNGTAGKFSMECDDAGDFTITYQALEDGDLKLKNLTLYRKNEVFVNGGTVDAEGFDPSGEDFFIASTLDIPGGASGNYEFNAVKVTLSY